MSEFNFSSHVSEQAHRWFRRIGGTSTISLHQFGGGFGELDDETYLGLPAAQARMFDEIYPSMHFHGGSSTSEPTGMGAFDWGPRAANSTGEYDWSNIQFEAQARAISDYTFETTISLAPALAENWAAIFRSGISEELFLRIARLANFKDQWNGGGSRQMSPLSLNRFLSFWSEISSLGVEPELVLTSRGNVQAEWFKSSTRFFEVEFAVDGKDDNFFAIRDGTRTTFEGKARLKDLISICKSHRNGAALRWSPD
ncbi:MAG: hypothetical protein ACKVP2_03640 [Burkholderiales bacterium]